MSLFENGIFLQFLKGAIRKMKMKSLFKATSILMITCMSVCILGISQFSVKAAGFSGKGKGTVKSPYLVTNAQQVDEIRNNLSANYKLANNIDMSSVANFVPIGKFSAPFTGTFTCDTSSDGTPKYIIKNLNIDHRPTGATLAEKYSGFKSDGSMGWEAGFFGQTKGATLKNIVILNATVKSTVEGNSSMNSDWSINEGQSLEQSTGILVGTALNTKITGCGSSGTVTSASNNVGGLVGTLTAEKGKTASIKNSYSYANVSTTGVWNSGGFCGGNETYWEKYTGKVSIESCFYQGTFTGSYTSAGAFCGPMTGNSYVKNCWAGGKVMTSSSGCFYATDVYGSGIKKNTEACENCYTTAVIEGRTKAQTNKILTKNNWISDAPGGLEIGFAAGSMAEINAAFGSISAWKVSDGTYPQLKDVHPITSPDSYNPIADNTNASAAADGNTASDTQAATDSDSTSSDVTVEDGTDGNSSGGKISTTVKNTDQGARLAEKILFIVLSVIIVILIGLTIFVVIKWFILNKKFKMSLVEGDSSELTDSELYANDSNVDIE